MLGVKVLKRGSRPARRLRRRRLLVAQRDVLQRHKAAGGQRRVRRRHLDHVRVDLAVKLACRRNECWLNPLLSLIDNYGV